MLFRSAERLVQSLNLGRLFDALSFGPANGTGNGHGDQIMVGATTGTAAPTTAPQPVMLAKPAPAEAQGRVMLTLSGMHCASCAAVIERSLRKVPGVTHANVNFAAEKASILFDGALTTPERLVEAVRKIGYGAERVDPADTGAEGRNREAKIGRLRQRFAVSLALSLPMLYFMVLDFFPRLPGGSALPPYFGLV